MQDHAYENLCIMIRSKFTPHVVLVLFYSPSFTSATDWLRLKSKVTTTGTVSEDMLTLNPERYHNHWRNETRLS
jgi:hypothetical protein